MMEGWIESWLFAMNYLVRTDMALKNDAVFHH